MNHALNDAQAVKPMLEDWFDRHKVCILLPTYNNAGSLESVINGCLRQSSHVLVVNDGSTDQTAELIRKFPVHSVEYAVNKGKGYALRQGFRKALELGYRYVITLDTDGQHYPEDCRAFLEALDPENDEVMIGSRDLNQANVPGKSSFGNRFSNFWFWVETGRRMPDTQSGFRLYPIHRYRSMHFFTRKYEFEIEVIVRSAWMGIPVVSIPVQVFYPDKDKRVSHFRPFRDFFRISVLNTVLVLIALLYIKPRDLLYHPIRKKGWRQGLRELLFNPNESSLIRAASVGFGVFMGILPIWGFQLLVGIPLAILMRLNKTLFIVAANISIFPPVIWAASLATGKLVYRNPNWKINFRELKWEEVVQTGKEFFVGGTVLAIIAGFASFCLIYALLLLRSRYKQRIRISK